MLALVFTQCAQYTVIETDFRSTPELPLQQFIAQIPSRHPELSRIGILNAGDPFWYLSNIHVS